jgi:hypothetical protein
MTYHVTFAEVGTGIVLNLDGTRFLGQEKLLGAEFTQIEDAREFAQTWLCNQPHAEAWIGTEADAQQEYFISEHFLTYDRERRTCYRPV